MKQAHHNPLSYKVHVMSTWHTCVTATSGRDIMGDFLCNALGTKDTNLRSIEEWMNTPMVKNERYIWAQLKDK